MNKYQSTEILKDLIDFARIPSISTLSEYTQEVRRAAAWLVVYLKKIGFAAGQVGTDGHPLVWAKWGQRSDQPTILFYGHYDVQPPDPVDEWQTPPFEPTIKGDKLFGRGLADNKGQLFINLLAIKQLLEEQGTLPVNVGLVVEGEEEIGSIHFDQAFKKVTARLNADAALVTDAGLPKANQPALTYGLRGIVAFEIEVIGPKRDLHSGSFGGMVENPAYVLSKLLAQLKDKNGRIAVPGIYDRVLELTGEDREYLASVPRSEAEEKQEAGVRELISEPGYSPRESAKVRPSLDIHGLVSGFASEGIKTIIPAKAKAKFSIRLVPSQDPEEIASQTVKFLNSHCPETVECRIKVQTGSAPVRVNPQSEFARLVNQGLEAAFGRKPVFNLMGGSIPAAAVLAGAGLPTIMTGFTLPDSRVHAPNENLDLPHFFQGIEAIKEILRRLQTLKI